MTIGENHQAKNIFHSMGTVTYGHLKVNQSYNPGAQHASRLFRFCHLGRSSSHFPRMETKWHILPSRLTWKLPAGHCKCNQVFAGRSGSFHLSNPVSKRRESCETYPRGMSQKLLAVCHFSKGISKRPAGTGLSGLHIPGNHVLVHAIDTLIAYSISVIL